MIDLAPAKRLVFLAALEVGRVLVRFDARADGVKVPAPHNENPNLVLRIAYGLTPPLDILAAEDALYIIGMTFGGRMFPQVVIPWAAVSALQEETTGAIAMVAFGPPRASAPEPEKPRRAKLSLVPEEN